MRAIRTVPLSFPFDRTHSCAAQPAQLVQVHRPSDAGHGGGVVLLPQPPVPGRRPVAEPAHPLPPVDGPRHPVARLELRERVDDDALPGGGLDDGEERPHLAHQVGAGRRGVAAAEQLEVERGRHPAPRRHVGQHVVQDGGEVLALRRTRRAEVEVVVAAHPHPGPGRTGRVRREHRVGVGAALGGLEVGERHPGAGHPRPVHRALVVGEVDAAHRLGLRLWCGGRRRGGRRRGSGRRRRVGRRARGRLLGCGLGRAADDDRQHHHRSHPEHRAMMAQ